MAEEQYGRIRENFERKKKIDEWTFTSPHQESAFTDPEKYNKLGPMVATISLEKCRTSEDGELVFSASSNWWKDDIRNKNIDALREEVRAAFELSDRAARNFVWEDWIEIRVSGARYDTNDKLVNHPDDASLTIDYEILKRGTGPKGEDISMAKNGHISSFPKAKKAGVQCEGRDGEFGLMRGRAYYQEEDEQFAYLPATPENIAAIEGVIARLHMLRSELARVLDQKQIKATIANVASIALPRLESKR